MPLGLSEGWKRAEKSDLTITAKRATGPDSHYLSAAAWLTVYPFMASGESAGSDGRRGESSEVNEPRRHEPSGW